MWGSIKIEGTHIRHRHQNFPMGRTGVGWLASAMVVLASHVFRK